jgi:hypothetical protein
MRVFANSKERGKERSTSSKPPALFRRRMLRSPPRELSPIAAFRPALISLHHLATLLGPAQVGERGRSATGSRSRHDLGSSCGGARCGRGGDRGGGGRRVGGEFGERIRAQRDAGEEGQEYRRVALQSRAPQNLESVIASCCGARSSHPPGSLWHPRAKDSGGRQKESPARKEQE